MTPLDIARGAQIAAMVGGIALWVRRPSYGPIALYLVTLTAISAIRRALSVRVLEPARDALRAAGLDPGLVAFTEARGLAAVHIDGALTFASSALLAAIAIVTFGERRRALAVIAGAWLVSSVVLAATYPSSRGSVRATCFVLAAVLAIGGSLVVAGRWATRREAPDVEHVLAFGFAVLTFAALVVTRGAIFTRWGPLASIVLLIGYSSILIVEIITWIHCKPHT